MSRPLRIEYPGAWYHIMNRGGRYEAIFEDKIDYSVFLELLQETIEIFRIKVSAFCLMQTHYFIKKKHIEVPESRLLAPETDKIKAVVCTKYKVSISDLRISIRGQLNEPRNVAMYLMRHLRGDALSTICNEFGLKKDSSAGSIVDRVKKQILKDKQFRNKLAGIKKIISKS